jgi:hypothetical protein
MVRLQRTGIGVAFAVAAGIAGCSRQPPEIVDAGFTDVCPMVFFVAKCPWNRTQAKVPVPTR